MATISRFALVVLMFCVPFAFADVGPSPTPPEVVVHLVNGGAPETSISGITYHCMGTTETETSSAIDPYPIALPCSGGNCSNSGSWYYKFNPCFKFPEGYFSYDFGGRTVRTESFNFSGNFTKYEMTVDAPSGQISSKMGSSCSLGALALGATVLGSVALGFARER